jgi:hypothetical protein
MFAAVDVAIRNRRERRKYGRFMAWVLVLVKFDGGGD